MHHLSGPNSEERAVRAARIFLSISGIIASIIMFFVSYSWIYNSDIIEVLINIPKDIIIYVFNYAVSNSDKFIEKIIYSFASVSILIIIYKIILNKSRKLYSEKKWFRKFLRGLRLSDEYFGGKWKIELYIDGDDNSPHTGTLFIRQEISSISVKLQTSHSISTSTSASYIIQSDSVVLTYTYNCYQRAEKSDTKSPSRGENNREVMQLQHEGVCIKTFVKDEVGQWRFVSGRFVNNFGIVSSGRFYAAYPVDFCTNNWNPEV